MAVQHLVGVVLLTTVYAFQGLSSKTSRTSVDPRVLLTPPELALLLLDARPSELGLVQAEVALAAVLLSSATEAISTEVFLSQSLGAFS